MMRTSKAPAKKGGSVGTAKGLNKMKMFFWVIIIISASVAAGLVLISRYRMNSEFPHAPKMHLHSDQPFNLHEFMKCKELFIFGDSTVDSGTSNMTKDPYGIDFHEGPTEGRFSNGKTSADYLASWMGKSIPVPFNNNMNMMPNVPISFASGGCGLLNRTRVYPPYKCFSLREQIEQFSTVKSIRITAKDLFFLSIGSNDFLLSLNLDNKTSRANVELFVKNMASEYVTYLQRLHSCGARKFLVNNIGPLGCIPDRRIRLGGKCNEDLNEVVQHFNANLTEALKNFVKDFEVEVVFADSNTMFSLFLEDPQKYGFKFTKEPCCGAWKEEIQRFDCNKESALCEDRKLYLFFDGAHPTAEANFHFIQNCISSTICKPLIVTN